MDAIRENKCHRSSWLRICWLKFDCLSNTISSTTWCAGWTFISSDTQISIGIWGYPLGVAGSSNNFGRIEIYDVFEGDCDRIGRWCRTFPMPISINATIKNICRRSRDTPTRTIIASWCPRSNWLFTMPYSERSLNKRLKSSTQIDETKKGKIVLTSTVRELSPRSTSLKEFLKLSFLIRRWRQQNIFRFLIFYVLARVYLLKTINGLTL